MGGRDGPPKPPRCPRGGSGRPGGAVAPLGNPPPEPIAPPGPALEARRRYLIATRLRTWQATQCPCETSLSTCSFSEHEGTRSAQRVWKRQPDGGLMGLGTSPSSRIRLRFMVGSGIGTAERSASVYGCFGFV